VRSLGGQGVGVGVQSSVKHRRGPIGCPAVPTIKETVGRVRRRAVNRVRGEPVLARLVADGLRLGEQPHVAQPLYIDGLHPWLITIGDYVTLGPYVAIITHDASLYHYTASTRLGRVDIGDRVYVGVGAIILPGTKIGEDSVIGAGAVVHGEIPPGSLAVGNPAKASPIKSVVAWSRATASRAPNWPREGWNLESGITEERKLEQRDALADCAPGFVPAAPPPGSPYERKGADTAKSSDKPK
jgi:maltose O-acetyltransferase